MSLHSVVASAAAVSLLALSSSVGAQSKGDARRGEYLVKAMGWFTAPAVEPESGEES